MVPNFKGKSERYDSIKEGMAVIIQAIFAAILSISIVSGTAATEIVEFKNEDQGVLKCYRS